MKFPSVLLLFVQVEFYKSSVGRGVSEPTNCTMGDQMPVKAAAAKLLQSCVTLWEPIDGSPPVSHQSPLSLGFSRQEHWSGLPFPSLMHEGEKRK